MAAVAIAFLIVAIILFVLAALPPTAPWHGTLVAIGLAFFAASFLPALL